MEGGEKTMKRSLLLVAGAAAAWLLVFAVPALADNGPHMMGAGTTPDTCAGCHRLHTAPNARLLKVDGTALCYTCHGADGSGASTDVQSGVQYSATARPPAAGVTQLGALRGGGFSYALIDSANPAAYPGQNVPVLEAGQPVTSTHSVNSSNVVAWGNTIEGAAAPQFGTTIPLRCGSCHDPHGNGYYRILRPKPSGSGISRTSTTNGGVGILDVATKAYTTTNYWSVGDSNATAPAPPYTGAYAPPVNMPFNGIAANTGTGQPLVSGIASWCSTCHTRYLAPSGSAQTPLAGDAIFTYRHTSNREISSTGNARNCVQCHVAHGSNAVMGGPHSGNVNNPDNTPDPGGSKLLRINNRGVCQVCHNK